MSICSLPRPFFMLLTLLLAGCGAAASGGAPSVVGPRLDSGGGGGGRHVLANAPAASRRIFFASAKADSAQAPAEPEGAPPSRRPATTQESPDRLIVRTAFLRIERNDPQRGAKAAAGLAKRFGGWVQRSDNRSATIMVPAERLDEILGELCKLGDVVKRDVRGEDVTEEYLDLRIRLDNLGKARQRYLELLAKAANVTETLAVEKELQRVTLEIERLKGRIAYLERVVRYSTIHVTFRRGVSPGPIGWIFYGLYHGVKWLFVWD